jgi:hypothetical protein
MGSVLSWKRMSAKKQMMSTIIDIWLLSMIEMANITIVRIKITQRHTFNPASIAFSLSSIFE